MFFLLLALIFFAAVLLATNEKEGWLTTLVFGSIIYLSWGNSFTEIFTWVGTHLHWLTLGFFTYFTVGGLWSVVKWKLLVNAAYNDWIDTGGAEASKESHRPYVSRYIPRIYGWIMFWWASMVAYVFGEMLVNFVDFIITRLRGVYERITSSKFGPSA